MSEGVRKLLCPALIKLQITILLSDSRFYCMRLVRASLPAHAHAHAHAQTQPTE